MIDCTDYALIAGDGILPPSMNPSDQLGEDMATLNERRGMLGKDHFRKKTISTERRRQLLALSIDIVDKMITACEEHERETLFYFVSNQFRS